MGFAKQARPGVNSHFETVLVSSFWHSRELEPRGHLHQLSKGVGLHLLHHFAAMRLHCDLAYAELPANLFIQTTGNYQLHILPLTMCE
jgi:hypothetical protein